MIPRQIISNALLELMQKYDLKRPFVVGGRYFDMAALMPWQNMNDYSKHTSWPNTIGIGILNHYSGIEDIIDYTPYKTIELNKNYTLEHLFEDFVDICKILQIEYREPNRDYCPSCRRDHF